MEISTSNRSRNTIVSLFGLSTLSVAAISFKFNIPTLAIIAFSLVDIFLIALLIEAAKASKPGSTYISILFPTRLVGLITFFIFFLAIGLSFATNYISIAENKFDAFCFSIGTMTTVSIVNLPTNSTETKVFMLLELFSTILLFFAAFPLLLARLSTFRG